jgi:membrane protein
MATSQAKKYNFIDALKIIMENWNRAAVMQGAAEMAYYLLLSLVPILLVIANIIPLLPIDTAEVLNLLEQAFPADINEILIPIVTGYLESASGGAISIGLLASIWSASNVFSTMRRVLDEVYGAANAKNFIIARVLSLAVMLVILLVVGVAVFIFVFGEQIFTFINDFFGIQIPLVQEILQLRWIALPLILFAVGLIVYDLVPNHHLSIKYAIPGAIFMTVGLVLLSQSFSLITQFMGGDAAANQTIGGFIVLMLFLYISNAIILIGALVNTLTFELKNGQSVLSYETELQEKEELEESEWGGYPNEEKTVLLKRKLYKVK